MSLWLQTLRDVGLRKLQVGPTCRQALVGLLLFSRSLCPLIVKLVPGNWSTCACRLQVSNFIVAFTLPLRRAFRAIVCGISRKVAVCTCVCVFAATPELNS